MKLVSMRSLMIFLCVLPASASFGQTAKDEVHDLERTVVKQQRYMRGFSADSVVRWQWIDDRLALVQPRARMLSAFVADSVKLKGDKIVIEGNRFAVVRKDDDELAMAPLNDHVEIDIDLQGADIDRVLPTLVELVFFSGLDEALGQLPERLKKVVPPSSIAKSPFAAPKSTAKPDTCDCAELSAPTCGKDQPELGMRGMKPPRLTHSVDPAFTEQAHQQKFSGNVLINLGIDSAGHPTDLWVIRPVGMGLDENAVTAVSQYKFTPASCHGRPVAVDLLVAVNFQIF